MRPLALVFPILIPAVAFAATIHVPGDQPTIQAGLSAASPGDVVLVAPGMYYEHDIQLAAGVELESEAGAAGTVIDAQSLGSCLIGADGATVRGFTLQNSASLNEAGIWCYETTVTIEDNVMLGHDRSPIVMYRSNSVVRRNQIHVDVAAFGEGIQCSQSGPVISENTIYATDPNGNASAINISYPSPDDPYGATIEDNLIYGRIFINSARPTTVTEIRNNLIVIENGFSSAFNLAFSGGVTRISNNTIAAPGGTGFFLQGGSDAEITNNIIMNSDQGIEVWSGGTVVLDCNDFWNNAEDYGGVAPGPNDFSADPLFCDPKQGDFTLSSESPCLPGQHPDGADCGLIGAFGLSCGPTAITKDTWGRIKGRYRVVRP